MTIKLLSHETAEKIAAGEVIERPASVVKELLDNALDAKATRITVEIIEGGIKFIKVSDNGMGISFEELPIAFLRHATSKIASVHDLESLTTLGFRGEALPSIAAISKTKLISKPVNQLTAGEIIIEGGKQISYQETPSANGTTVIVENLFFNTPARLKFLKSSTHEASLVSEVISEYALGNPYAAFVFISNGKKIINTSGNNNLREVIAEIWGKQIAAQLKETEYSNELIKIKAFLSPPEISRSNRKQQVFFVNGRLVKNQILSTALEEQYRGILPFKRYPLGLIKLDIPASDIDVNVHPAKTLIKFHDDRAVFSAIRKTVQTIFSQPQNIENNLREEETTQFTNVNENYSQEIFREFKKNDSYSQLMYALPYLKEDNSITQLPLEKDTKKTEESIVEKPLFPLLKVKGNYKNSYILAEGNDALFLIDQHAAHERILYEKFLASLSEKKFAQVLLQPMIIELPQNFMVAVTEIINTLNNYGFDISYFGDNSYLIRSVPDIFANLNVNEIITDIINELTEQKENDPRKIIAENLACKAAIKLKEQLHEIEMDKLLHDLSLCEEPFRCPHGRPTIIEISDLQINKWFKRVLS